MRRIWATRTQASALSLNFSRSRASRRQRPRPANVRSMTHLRGSTRKPLAVSDRLTIRNLQRPRPTSAVRSFGPRKAQADARHRAVA